MTQAVTAPDKRGVGGITPKPSPNVEVGVGVYLPFTTPYRNAWEVLRDEEVTVKQLVAMRKTDGQARALYRLITLPIRAALKGATFVPETGVDGGDEEAKFIEAMFTLPAGAGGMMVPFNRFIAQLLLAIFDGFSAFEMVYQSPDAGPLEGKWTLKKLAYRPAETITFLMNDKGEYAGLRQRTVFQGRNVDVPIPGEHSFYWAANEEENPFYGQSFFQSAFYHWDKKFRLYVIAHLAAQRAAVGTRVGKLPANPNNQEKRDFQKALADLGVAQWMTMPDSYSVDSLKEATGFDFLSLINHHNSQMSKSVLAEFFDKEQGGGDSGKLVDFGTQSDALFLLMLQTIMGEIEEVINQKIIPRFIDWNFGTGRYPKFQFGQLSAEQKQAMFDLFKQLAVAGQALTISPELVHQMEKQVSEELGLEIDWETVEAQQAEQQRQEALQAELEAQQQAGAVGGGQAAPTPVQVPANLVPKGFTLTQPADPTIVALTGLARELLDEANHSVTLTRGVPTSGGPKYVRTAAGALVYGVPVGSPITRDMQQRAGAHGPKGGPFGNITGRPSGKDATTTPAGGGPGDTRNTSTQLLGGGPGAPAQNPGNVITAPDMPAPKQEYINPDAPGAKLLDFGDGTVAIEDATGNLSPRQRFEVADFLQLGWKVSHQPGGHTGATGNAKTAPAKSGKAKTSTATTGAGKTSRGT